MDMTIGVLAKKAGVGVETVRYYQREGLMPPAKKHQGAYAVYGEAELQRLRSIREAQKLGFSLKEVASLLALNNYSDHQRARALAQTRIDEIDNRISQLQQMRSALQQLVYRCEHGQRDQPCPILLALGGGDTGCCR